LIIIDDFVRDEELLRFLRMEAALLYPKDYFWKDKDAEPYNHTEQFCQMVFDQYAPVKRYSGFEYWANRLSLEWQQELPWHYDKDEFFWRETGSIVSPDIGMIYYAHEELPVGGYLEVDWQGELERIQPKPNRLILFDPSTYHRVTPVDGERMTIAANIWYDPSSPENFSEEKVQLHK